MMQGRLVKAGAAAAGLLMAGWLAWGAVYKWVDEQGRTHYGSSPPTGAKSTPVDIAPPPDAETTAQAASAARRVIEQARQLAAEREWKEVLRQAEETEDGRKRLVRSIRCAVAQHNFDALRSPGPVYRYNDAGERIDLPDSQRSAEVQRLKKESDEACAGLDRMAELRRWGSQIERGPKCAALREQLRDLEAPGARSAPSDIERVRAELRQLCPA